MPTYVFHIAAGGVSIIAGFIALYASKGAPLHRRAGLVFVYAMLGMVAAGMALTIVRQAAPALNLSAGLLTAVLVVTALTALRPRTSVTRGVEWAGTAGALVVAASNLFFGYEAIVGVGRDGMPAFPFFMFGVVASLAVVGDLRLARAGPPRGPTRLGRHLWRMSFALFVAALSFFIGQAQVFPKPIRIMPVLALPVLAVLITMLYWMWRVSIRRSVRGLMQRSEQVSHGAFRLPVGSASHSPAGKLS